MAITPVGSSTSFSNTSSTAISTPLPAGVLEGDLLVWVLGNQNNSAITPDDLGWTTIEADNGTALGGLVVARFADSSEPASYTATTGGGGRSACAMIALRGVDPAILDAATPAPVTDYDTGAEAVGFPNGTTVTAGAWLCAAAMVVVSSGGAAPNFTTTNLDSLDVESATTAGSGAHVGAAFAHAELAAAGSRTPTIALASNPNRSIGITFMLRPAADEPATIEGAGAAQAPAAQGDGAGTLEVEGEAAVDAAAAQADAAGAVEIVGDGDAVAPAAQADGAGDVEAPGIEGDGAAIAPAAEAAAAGDLEISGAGDVDAPGAEGDGVGQLELTGAGDAAAPGAQASAAGDVEISGSGSAEAPVADVDAAGQLEISGEGVAQAPAAAAAGEGSVVEPGASVGHAVAPPAEAAGAGTVSIAGEGAGAAPGATAAAEGDVEIPATGAGEAPGAAASGAGDLVVAGTGAAAAAAAQAAADGDVEDPDAPDPTPAERTLVIAAESRVTAIAAPTSRRVTVAAAPPASRRYTVAAESRTVTFT